MDAIVAAIAGAVIATLLGGPVAYLLGLRRSRYERLEVKRAEVIAELSRLLFEVDERYFHWYRRSTNESTGEEGQDAAKSLEVLIRYFHSNVTWLDPKTADRVENYIEELREMGYHRYKAPGLGDFQGIAQGKKFASDSIARVRTIREELIREFREILYPYEWWQRIFPWGNRLKDGKKEARVDSKDG